MFNYLATALLLSLAFGYIKRLKVNCINGVISNGLTHKCSETV